MFMLEHGGTCPQTRRITVILAQIEVIDSTERAPVGGILIDRDCDHGSEHRCFVREELHLPPLPERSPIDAK